MAEPEWPEETPEYLARQKAVEQNGNDGAVYEVMEQDFVAPHEGKEFLLILSGAKKLATLEKSKNPLGFAMAFSLGQAGTLCAELVNTEGGAEVAFVKKENGHLLAEYKQLLDTGVADYGIKEYHRRMGRMFGYPEADIEEFINAEIECDCNKCKGK